ncbi:MFS transporter [Pectobacterium araliae]|uniref:MFS transporter n=1 Tax=Pectobacterium araliae TaxID=3073862 RepID=A0AAN0MM20_9GAMM|nr:MFS transporter [Pectobacterium sp. MAFF 302110]GKW20228.1 MFS transporter [Pectobacterium carotovorum subsp. carotovorum]
MNNETTVNDGWSASVTNEQQPKAPVLLGFAVGIGALLWLGPFMGINSVLNPAKLSNIIGQGAEVNNFLALLGTLGAITSTITTIIIGALSDLTRSRWGRRTPWILVGSVLTAAVMIGLGMINTKEQLGTFIALWCLLQTFINFVVAPLLAVIADQIAPRHRGLISSIYAAGFIVGQYGGPVVGGFFLSDVNPHLVNTGYYVLALAMLLSGPIAAMIIKEKSSLDMPHQKINKENFVQYFVFPVRNARDFYLALFGKMLVTITITAFSVYQLFFLTSGMGLNNSSAGHYISLMGIATMVTALIFAPIAGPISDRLRTRKKPVFIATLLIALGTVIPFFYGEPAAMIWYGVVAGIGSGIFFSVDQALNLEVLPNPENSAKDLGILNFANTGAQILGPVLGAVLFNLVGQHYLPILPILAIISLAGGCLVMMIKQVG